MTKAALRIERNLVVPMLDGVRLFANLYRPADDQPRPVIMSVTLYGKDKLPGRLAALLMRLSGVKFGKLHCSLLTGFEAPDPVYWVQQDYAVLQANVRGMFQFTYSYPESSGHLRATVQPLGLFGTALVRRRHPARLPASDTCRRRTHSLLRLRLGLLRPLDRTS